MIKQEDKPMSDFADRLKLIRTMRDNSLEEMASILNTTKQTLSRYERSERFPKSPVIKRYADKLGVKASWLIGYDDDLPEVTKSSINRDELKSDIDSLCDDQVDAIRSMVNFMKSHDKQVK